MSWPKSPFAGTSVCLRWCWGCQEQPHQTTSSLAASPQMSLPSLRCVKSLEVRHFLTSVPRRWSCIHTNIYFHNHYASVLFLVALIIHSVIYDSCASCFSQGDRTACGHRGCWTSVWSLWSRRFKVVLSLILRRQGRIRLKVSFWMTHTECKSFLQNSYGQIYQHVWPAVQNCSLVYTKCSTTQDPSQVH